MAARDEDRFRPKVGPPRNRGRARTPRFTSRVLKAAGKAGPTGGGSLRPTRTGRGATHGRGHVAARFAGSGLGPRARHVIIKTRLVVLKQAGLRSTETHLRYIERDGVTPAGEKGRAYGLRTDTADTAAFEERGREDRHQFRFIVSPEDAAEIGDLKTFVRDLMSRMEADLGTRLDWVAVDHWDTDNPHTHIVLRGVTDAGNDLVIARDYISHGMRQRACELATEWLGPRTEQEIRTGLTREVDQPRWTSLDRTIQRSMQDGVLDLREESADANGRFRHSLLLGRLRHLATMTLADEDAPDRWVLRPDAETTLRRMGEREDIIRTMQRSLRGTPQELAIFDPAHPVAPVIGRIAGKGLTDELGDRGYLIVEGVDGRAHYVALRTGAELNDFPVGGIVEARGSTEPRTADRTIAGLAANGIYRTETHLTVARAETSRGQVPEAFVAAHVRRLEALRRAGIAERIADGIWRVPPDLAERGLTYDRERLGGTEVVLGSHLPLEHQVRRLGATWLDRQLIDGGRILSDKGFGAAARQALQDRADFLVSEGLAERRGRRLLLARNLLTTLRERDVAAVAKTIQAETGLAYRPISDGDRVAGIYRRSVLLASGRFALLDDSVGFSLVPWRPVLEQRLGQDVTGLMRGSGMTWLFSRQRGPSL